MKKELEKAEELLKETLQCLNQIPNKKVSSTSFTSTYEICSSIEKFLNRERCQYHK